MIKLYNIETLVNLYNEAVALRVYYEQAHAYGDATEERRERYNNAEQRFKAYAQALMKEESK